MTNSPVPADHPERSLDELEAVVERNIPEIRRLYFQVGAALREIHDNKLWPQTMSWAVYCARRFNLHDSYAFRLMRGSEVYAALPDGYRPANEAQARELAKADDDLRIPAMQAAVEVAAGGKISAELVALCVRAASEVAQEALATHGFVSSDGDSHAIQGAVTEEVLEGIKRRAQEIAGKYERRRRQILALDGPLGDILREANNRLRQDHMSDLGKHAYIIVQFDKAPGE